MIAPTESPLPPTAASAVIAAPTPITTQPAAEPPGRRGLALNLVSRRNIRHQDVHQDVSAALSTWGPGIAYSRLMRFRSGADVALPSLAVECELCERWTMLNDTAFEFTLRPDVLWQDLQPVNGRPLVAADIASSYERQRADGAPNAPLLHTIDTIDAPADDRLRITLIAADADLLTALADGHSKIVAKEAVEISGDLKNGPTVGSSPWILTETQPDAAHTFRRNDDYFEPGAPMLDRIRMHIITDADTAYAAFRVQRIDVHQIRPLEWEDFRRQQPDAAMLRRQEIGTGLEVAFNTTEPPFDDLRVRQAAMLAMDPWSAIADIWDSAAYLTQGVPLASADWQLTDDEMRAYFNDHPRARALLADAAVPLPIPIAISAGDFGERYQQHAERIARKMQAVGFDPRLEVVNMRRFGEDVWFGGDYKMFIGPNAPVVSPNGYLLPILGSSGAWNTTGHANDALDALILAQAQEYDPLARQKLVRDAQRITLENAYRFMPAATVSIWAWWPQVQDFTPNFAASEYSHWSRVWIK